MNSPTTANPEPIPNPGSLTPLVDTSSEAQLRILEPSQKSVFAPPSKTFFRGVAVGLAIMIPIWVWLALKLLR